MAQPGSAGPSAIRSLPGDNRTLITLGSTLQHYNTPATYPIRSALQQLKTSGFGPGGTTRAGGSAFWQGPQNPLTCMHW